jgi:hypothetical protein
MSPVASSKSFMSAKGGDTAWQWHASLCAERSTGYRKMSDKKAAADEKQRK